MSSAQRIDALTGIRGLAALLVVYSHLAEDGFFSRSHLYPGEVGVMVFFTLSGFLMAFLYGHKQFDYSSVVRYGISRFSRIAPAYLFVVIGSYLIYNLIDPSFVYAITHQNLLRHLLFSGNVSALWSIPPEVQFYAVFVGLWFALWKFRNQGNASVLAIVLTAIFLLISYRDQLPGTFVGSKMQYFFSGVLFGLFRNQAWSDKGMRTLALLQGLTLIVIGLVIARILPVEFGSKREFYNYLEGALFSGIFVFMFSFDTPLGKLLFGHRPIMMCGEFSFSMYLLNIPVIYVAMKLLGDHAHTPAMAALITLVVFLLAWLMYRVIELPGNTLLRRIGTRLFESRPLVAPARPEATDTTR
ncbi:acyltransferase [Xanthomonas hydrangeae]|uniref:Acyltransferase n=1 Tax=Xanthomonas hydrangeae TaxID=2775159 RepID=A0AAU0B4F0_9XANT|nr:acyltransferase [Xanthomonas hydrangeae]WOB47953.1 acyltransferase [Xanthomonas hydrangeae]